uniref:Uncharacterized protein n=1 Tax=Arundo donax TaxID=35708 RepID=A0A0A8ZAH9_ARUDO
MIGLGLSISSSCSDSNSHKSFTLTILHLVILSFRRDVALWMPSLCSLQLVTINRSMFVKLIHCSKPSSEQSSKHTFDLNFGFNCHISSSRLRLLPLMKYTLGNMEIALASGSFLSSYTQALGILIVHVQNEHEMVMVATEALTLVFVDLILSLDGPGDSAGMLVTTGETLPAPMSCILFVSLDLPPNEAFNQPLKESRSPAASAFLFTEPGNLSGSSSISFSSHSPWL